MTYIVIENKKTRKRTYFTTRAAAIEFIKKENPDIPTKVLNSWKTNDIILEYLKDYNVVVLV
jgi:hypothetical protein